MSQGVAMDMLVNVDVDDLDAAVSFYTSAFGLRIGRRLGSGAVELTGASAPIYLLLQPAGTAPAPVPAQPRSYARHWTPVHLDFVVEDVDAAVRLALAAGARLEGPVSTHAWGKLARLCDPFGHGCCLVQFLGRGYDALADT